MKLLIRLSWAAIALASAQVLVAAAMTLLGNPSGWLGGVFYAVAYALPLVLVALALRSHRPVWPKMAGWAALGIAAYDILIVVANWAGYSTTQAVFATSITVPAVAVYGAVFWATVVRRPPAAAPAPTSG
jgi:hypothetical protein